MIQSPGRRRLLCAVGWENGVAFSYVDLEAGVRKDHPLRPIRLIVNETLSTMERDFAALFAESAGRPWHPRCCLRGRGDRLGNVALSLRGNCVGDLPLIRAGITVLVACEIVNDGLHTSFNALHLGINYGAPVGVPGRDRPALTRSKISISACWPTTPTRCSSMLLKERSPSTSMTGRPQGAATQPDEEKANESPDRELAAKAIRYALGTIALSILIVSQRGLTTKSRTVRYRIPTRGHMVHQTATETVMAAIDQSAGIVRIGNSAAASRSRRLCTVGPLRSLIQARSTSARRRHKHPSGPFALEKRELNGDLVAWQHQTARGP